MKILVFGITGMLGHVLWDVLSKKHDASGTVRSTKEDLLKKYPIIFRNSDKIIENVDVTDFSSIKTAFNISKPDIVINCVGVIKQLKDANDPVKMIMINSLFPQILAQMCQKSGSRLIHISTDCVFSGKRGNYSESDIADARDLYGLTKLLGEATGDNCLTIRTSLIGHELREKASLLEWFLAQKNSIKGFKKAVFSGLTTEAFSSILDKIIKDHRGLSGLYNIASEPIDKYELLQKLKKAYKKKIEIVPDEQFVIDRSLDPGKFVHDTHISVPGWDSMIEQMTKRS